jgi:hypothetical protein
VFSTNKFNKLESEGYGFKREIDFQIHSLN